MSVEVHLVLATVPWRRTACQRLLDCLPRQTRVPDSVLLRLDGYASTPEPDVPHSIRRVEILRTREPSGPGRRWRLAEGLPPASGVVVLDDDVDIGGSPRLIEQLVEPVVRLPSVATAASGFCPNGAYLWMNQHYAAEGGARADGGGGAPLLCATSNVMAVRAGDLVGLTAWVHDLGLGFDILGPRGDDEAAVSAYLWKRGVAIRHVSTVGLANADVPADRSETASRRAAEGAAGKSWDWQRQALRKACGWPWPETTPEVRPPDPRSLRP